MTTPSLTLRPLTGVPLINPGDDLAGLLMEALEREVIDLQDGDILVLAQKIVSKAEGCLVNLNDVAVSSRAQELAIKTNKDPRLVELILQQSREVLRARPGVLIVEHQLGFICANAGIDHSNISGAWGKAEDWVLLLPENPDGSAAAIRANLESISSKQLGVMIIDSHGRPWRVGTVGVAIGFSGLPGLVDLRGAQDIFGYRLQMTMVAAADELAAAASLMMGQAAERIPAVHVRGFPYPLREATLGELIRPREQDLFR